MALLLCAAVAAAAQAQQPSTSGMDEFYSNGGRQSAPAPGGGPMYGNGQYGRDAQCGGTDRAYYNKLYGSTAIVLDVVQAQQLYRATHGQIWYRCGGCGEQTICWPRPGYEQLLAQAPPRQGPPATSSRSFAASTRAIDSR